MQDDAMFINHLNYFESLQIRMSAPNTGGKTAAIPGGWLNSALP